MNQNSQNLHPEFFRAPSVLLEQQSNYTTVWSPKRNFTKSTQVFHRMLPGLLCGHGLGALHVALGLTARRVSCPAHGVGLQRLMASEAHMHWVVGIWKEWDLVVGTRTGTQVDVTHAPVPIFTIYPVYP